jgi:hypothetical protein
MYLRFLLGVGGAAYNEHQANYTGGCGPVAPLLSRQKERTMKDAPKPLGPLAAATNAPSLPAAVDRDGRPISQWSRLAAGRSDDLGTAGR